MRRIRSRKNNTKRSLGMKKIFIEVWLDEKEDTNDENVGKALGKAFMTNSLNYIEEDAYLGTLKAVDQKRGQ